MDLFLTTIESNLDNLTLNDNQAVIQISTGQAWWYLNDKFVPFAGGYQQDLDNYVVSVFINGVLVNDRILFDSFKIMDNLNEKVNTCSFDYLNLGNIANDLEFGMTITVFDFNLNKIFAGQILDFDKEDEGVNTGYIVFSTTASSWEKLLQTKKVAENYQNKTCKEIIDDIFNRYLPSIGTDLFVETGLEIDSISFNYIGIDQCLKKLADIANFEWYVDYDKNLHFFEKSTNLAPVVIEEGGKFTNFKTSIDGSQLKNAITLKGGYYLEMYYNDIQVADGEQTNFLTAYTPYSPVSVYIDSGSGFVQKTVGTKNLVSSGYDFVVSFSEKNIENLDAATLSAGDVIKITYNRQVPVLAYGEDTTSIVRMKALNGGDGKYEDVISDTDIETLETANNRIKAELESYSNPLLSGSFKTNISGFQSGQLLTIILPDFNLNSEQVLIQSVQTIPKTNQQPDGSYLIEYNIKFATSIKGLQEFLLDLYNKGKNIVINENETINTYYQYIDDIIFFENDSIEYSQHTSGTYRYDEADALWDFAQWS